MEIYEYIIADDRRLVELVLEGDDAAFEHLFNRYREAIRRLFVQRLGASAEADADADDLLQETFIKVYLNIHRYDNRYTFGQWLYTIARNTFVDFARKSRTSLSIDEHFAAPAATTPTPEESIINSQQRMQIDRFLEQLSEQHRILFRLRFLEEYSYEEIAERLQMPMGSVKTGIHRARERMCKMIKNN